MRFVKWQWNHYYIKPVGNNIEYSINGATRGRHQIFLTSLRNLRYKYAQQIIRAAAAFTGTITEPLLLKITATGNTATCKETMGIFSLWLQGGTTAYQFSIDGGVTFQNSGSFTQQLGHV